MFINGAHLSGNMKHFRPSINLNAAKYITRASSQKESRVIPCPVQYMHTKSGVKLAMSVLHPFIKWPRERRASSFSDWR
jgi:hypothetical protein